MIPCQKAQRESVEKAKGKWFPDETEAEGWDAGSRRTFSEEEQEEQVRGEIQLPFWECFSEWCLDRGTAQ